MDKLPKRFEFQYHGGSWFVGVIMCGAYFGNWSWWALILAPIFLLRIWTDKDRVRKSLEQEP